MTLQPLDLKGYIVTKLDHQRVAVIIILSRANVLQSENIRWSANDVFRKQKSRRQFEITTRRPHRDRKTLASAILLGPIHDTNLQRFFDCQNVFEPLAAIDGDACNVGLLL